MCLIINKLINYQAHFNTIQWQHNLVIYSITILWCYTFNESEVPEQIKNVQRNDVNYGHI